MIADGEIESTLELVYQTQLEQTRLEDCFLVDMPTPF